MLSIVSSVWELDLVLRLFDVGVLEEEGILKKEISRENVRVKWMRMKGELQ